MTVIRNWTGCAHFGSDARELLNQLTKTEDLLKEITGQETGGKRKKRGVFNFIGDSQMEYSLLSSVVQPKYRSSN